MVKMYLEQAIKSIEEAKAKQVAVITDRVTREKILPYNSEVDSYRAKALAEVDAELNQKILALRAEYEGKKQDLVTLGEEKKKANADTVLASELALVTLEYDNAVAKLKAQISEIKE